MNLSGGSALVVRNVPSAGVHPAAVVTAGGPSLIDGSVTVRPSKGVAPNVGPSGMRDEATTPCVAFVIEALTVGGAEQLLVAMANSLVRRGWRVHMVCLTAPGELASRLGARRRAARARQASGHRPAPAPLRLRRLINRIAPRTVNSHLWVANVWTRASLIGTGIPIVVTEHNRDNWKPRHYRLIDRCLASLTRTLVAVSEDTARFYRDDVGIRPGLVRVINNGIDTRRYASGDGDRAARRVGPRRGVPDRFGRPPRAAEEPCPPARHDGPARRGRSVAFAARHRR